MLQGGFMLKKIAVILVYLLSVLALEKALAQGGTSTAEEPKPATTTEKPAGFFVEPMITGQQADSTIETSALPVINDDTSGTTTGYGLGAKVGAHFQKTIDVYLDGRWAQQDFKDSSYSSASGDSWTVGPGLAWETPWAGLRFTGTYVMDGEFDPESGASGVDMKFNEPTGARLGVGFKIAAVSLNLEYEDLTYDKSDIESFGSFAANTGTTVDYSSRGYIFNLGFPLSF
jgi:hypothetical protein